MDNESVLINKENKNDSSDSEMISLEEILLKLSIDPKNTETFTVKIYDVKKT